MANRAHSSLYFLETLYLSWKIEEFYLLQVPQKNQLMLEALISIPILKMILTQIGICNNSKKIWAMINEKFGTGCCESVGMRMGFEGVCLGNYAL